MLAVIIIIPIQKVQDGVYTSLGHVETPDNTFLRHGEESVLCGSQKWVGMDW